MANLSGVASAQPKSDAEQLNREGKEKMGVLDLEAAAAKFREAIALEPDARYYFNLCFTLEKLERLAEARAACEVTRKDPSASSSLRAKAVDLVASIDARVKGKPEPARAQPTTLADGEVVAQPAAGAAAGPQPAVAQPAVAQPMPAANATPPAVAQPATVTAPGPATGEAAPGAAVVRPWGVGARAGLSLATLDGGANDPERRKGLAAGVILLLRIHPAVSLQTEASYVQKGAEYTPPDGLGLADVKIHLDYLELPVLLRLAAPGGGFRPFGLAGAGVGILVSSKATAGDVEGDTDGIKKMDLAGVIGGGLEFPAGAGAIGIEARYWFGMTDIEDTDAATVKTRALTIAGSFLF